MGGIANSLKSHFPLQEVLREQMFINLECFLLIFEVFWETKIRKNDAENKTEKNNEAERQKWGPRSNFEPFRSMLDPPGKSGRHERRLSDP